MALNKAAILKHTGGCATREVHVPAWADESGDDVVIVRGMTIREFEVNQARADDGKATAAVLARCCQDSSGLRLFSDDDVAALAELPLADVSLVSAVIMELSGLSGDSGPKAPADAVADAVKNSETTDTDAPASS